jgi:hypothetical protein
MAKKIESKIAAALGTLHLQINTSKGRSSIANKKEKARGNKIL